MSLCFGVCLRVNQLSYVIYRITCLFNGKVYIGQTRQGLPKRIEGYRQSVTCRPDHNSAIISAIRKHGWDAFRFEEIDRTDSPEKLDNLERYWIAFYDATNREKGYNLQAGGAGTANANNGRMRKAIKCIETGQTYQSMAEAARANGFSPAALTLHMKGQNGSCNGQHWEWTGNSGAAIYETSIPVRTVFEETSKRQRQRNATVKTKVQCVETGEVFDSMTLAAAHYSIDKRDIYTSIERGIATFGRHWIRLGPKRRHNSRGCKTRPVKTLETGVVYPSMAVAARAVGVMTSTSIWCAIHREGQTAGGFHWAYAD